MSTEDAEEILRVTKSAARTFCKTPHSLLPGIFPTLRSMKFSLLCGLVLAGVVYGAEEPKASLRGVLPVFESANVAAPAKAEVSTLAECGTFVRPDDFDERAERGSIFNMLTVEEIDSVTAWMIAHSGLGLVAYDDADLYSNNYITHVYLAQPNKADALAYLESGNNRPARYAHVHLSMAGISPPAMRQYLVGPLPVNEGTVLSEPLAFGGVTDVPFDARPTTDKEYAHLEDLMYDVMGQLDYEMRDTYGTNFYAECPDDFCLTYSDTSPRGPKRDITTWYVIPCLPVLSVPFVECDHGAGIFDTKP
jgi:hypothetical protein